MYAKFSEKVKFITPIAFVFRKILHKYYKKNSLSKNSRKFRKFLMTNRDVTKTRSFVGGAVFSFPKFSEDQKW